jgi:hypothetical protein
VQKMRRVRYEYAYEVLRNERTLENFEKLLNAAAARFGETKTTYRDQFEKFVMANDQGSLSGPEVGQIEEFSLFRWILVELLLLFYENFEGLRKTLMF